MIVTMSDSEIMEACRDWLCQRFDKKAYVVNWEEGSVLWEGHYEDRCLLEISMELTPDG